MALFLGILKIIGIILLILLAVAAAIVLIVLFVPVCYEASGERRDEAMRGRARVTWLFRAISFSVAYDSGEAGGLTKELRIFGVPLEKIKAFFRRKKKERRVRGRKKRLEKIKKENPEQYEEMKAEAKARKEAARLEREAEERAAKERRAAEEAAKESEKERQKKPSHTDRIDRLKKEIVTAVKGIAVFFGKLIKGIAEIFLLPFRIVEKIQAFFGNMAKAFANVSRWASFLADERTHNALKLALKKIGKLLNHCRPRKLTGQVEFGLGDPAGTGTLLAGLCAIYPLYAGHVDIVPNFEDKELNGHLEMKGRIFLCYLVFIALTVYFNKNVKYVIDFIKNSKEEKENG